MLRHLDLGQREIGAAVVGLEEIDVPVEATVGPGVARLLQRLAAELPQPLEVDWRDLGLDLDHLVVDRPLVAEDVAQLARRLDRTDAHAGRVEIGLDQADSCVTPGACASLRSSWPSSFEDKLAFVFNRHAL